MGTTANVYCPEKDGKGYRSITIYYDGFIQDVGRLLLLHYTTEDDVNRLIDLGNISHLEPTLEDTIAYHRDQGEDLKIYHIDTIDEKEMESADYFYLFENGQWRSSKYKGKEFVPLIEAYVEKMEGIVNDLKYKINDLESKINNKPYAYDDNSIILPENNGRK